MGTKESRCTVGDYVTLVRGTTYKGTLVGEPGPALLGLGSIEPGGGFREGHYKTYGGDCPAKLMLFPGDLYVALKGATKDGSMVGSVARVPKTIPSGRLTQDTVKLEFRNPNPHESAYLYWLLRTPQYRAYCANRVTGSAVAALSREDFLAYPVPPLTDTRRHAVDLFECLENKIELNQQMNRTLEAIARALFKSWFIDFDPVRAKMDGRQPAGMDAETVALFPAEFEDSPLGQIPKGWQVETIDDVTSLIIDHRGKTPKKLGGGWSENGIPAISAKNIKSGRLIRNDAIRYVDQDLYDRWMKDPLIVGDILMTSEAPMGELLYLACETRYCLSQRLYGIRANPGICQPSYLYYLLASDEVQSELAGRATGTTVQGIRQSELRKISILLPDFEIQKRFSSVADPVLLKIYSNDDLNSNLQSIRDDLLPKLLSGEVRIKEAKKIVAEVA